METKTKLNIKLDGLKKSKSFMCLILNTKGTKNSFNNKILGLTLTEWVKFACGDIYCESVDYDKSENVLEFAKKHIDYKYDYSIILFSSTPLINHSTLESIMEYSEIKDINLCKLHKGYAVKNEYLQNNNNWNVDSVFSSNMDEFYIVENKSQFTYAFKVLSERINNFHINNGVEIISPNNTYIEPFVDIERGAKIMPHNTLKGKVVIDKDVILKENNTIENSKICKNSVISHSVVTDSVISEDVFIGSFSEIKNSLIGKNSVIENNCFINNYNVMPSSVIAGHSNLGENNDSNSGVR